MIDEAKPFPRWPRFRRRGEACAYVLRMFPNCPPWLAIEVAGDPEIFEREVRALRGSV